VPEYRLSDCGTVLSSLRLESRFGLEGLYVDSDLSPLELFLNLLSCHAFSFIFSLVRACLSVDPPVSILSTVFPIVVRSPGEGDRGFLTKLLTCVLASQGSLEPSSRCLGSIGMMDEWYVSLESEVAIGLQLYLATVE
jgi:hypothetical protein